MFGLRGILRGDGGDGDGDDGHRWEHATVGIYGSNSTKSKLGKKGSYYEE